MAVLFCFACLFLLEKLLLPKITSQAGDERSVPCTRSPRGGALPFASLFVENGLLYGNKKRKKFSGRIGTVLVIVKLSGTPGCSSWLPNISALRTIQ